MKSLFVMDHILRIPHPFVKGAIFGPNKQLISYSADEKHGVVAVWNKSELINNILFYDRILSIKIFKKGLIVQTYDYIRIYDLKDLKELKTIKLEVIRSITITHDEKYILILYYDMYTQRSKIDIIDLETYTQESIILDQVEKEYSSISAYSVNEIVIGSYGGIIQVLLRTDADFHIHKTFYEYNSISNIHFNGYNILYCTNNGEIKIIELSASFGQRPINYKHSDHVWTIDRNNDYIVSGSVDRTVKILDLNTNDITTIPFSDIIQSVCISSEDQLLVSCNDTVYLYELGSKFA